jgi:hypothetical protein
MIAMDSSLGFTSAWFASGVVAAESAAAFARYAAADPARPARHWRWLAFRDHVEESLPLSAERCRALYALGETETDANLAAAILGCILYQPGCPADVREKARSSSFPTVRRLAERRNPVAVRNEPPTPTPSV